MEVRLCSGELADFVCKKFSCTNIHASRMKDSERTLLIQTEFDACSSFWRF